MVKLGNQGVSALYLSETKIVKAMLGDQIVFSSAAPPTPTYTITASIDPAGSGTVTGAGTYLEGAQVTIKAVPEEGYEFTGWQEGGQVVSENAEYIFTVEGDRTLVAVFDVELQYIAGRDWWEVEIPASASGYAYGSVTYGSGEFVALGDGANSKTRRIARSPDGINWVTDEPLPDLTYWTDITYGNGKFVAVSGSRTFYTTTKKVDCSEDGISWTSSDLPYVGNWTSVAYGDGKFVTVNGGKRSGDSNDKSNKSAYSTDGITWTASSLPSSAYWESVCYGKRCGFSKRYFLVLVACRHLTCTKTECRKMFLSLIAPLTTIRLNRGKRSNRLPYIFAQGQER